MKRFAFLSSLLALLFTGCSTTTMRFNANEMNSIVIPLNELFTIDLHGNPTTGFTWRQIQSNEVSAILEFVDSSYKSDQKKKYISGAPGTFSFQYRAKSKGKCILEFEYLRPWEKNTAIANKKEITITVK